jgi:hypothetical protein
MFCLSYIWFSAITRRRNPVLALAVGILGVEGMGLVIGRGNCPLGPFQRRLGDPVPMFELFLPKRAAKIAVPILAGASVVGLLAVALRRPELDRAARCEPASAQPFGRGLIWSDCPCSRDQGPMVIRPPEPMGRG